MAKILPILILLAGLFGGLGAGFVLRPDPPLPPPLAEDAPDLAAAGVPSGNSGGNASGELVRMTDQFIIPVIDEGRVAALMVISLTLDVAKGRTQQAHMAEPRLRNAFLQAMFDHANQGGFEGVFTASTNMSALRTALREAAQAVLGSLVQDVLITEMTRRDT